MLGTATITVNFQFAGIRDQAGSPVALNTLGILVADNNNTNSFPGSTPLTSDDLLGATLTTGLAIDTKEIVATFNAADLGGGLVGFNGNLTNFAYDSEIAAGTKFALYWFPGITSSGSIVGNSQYYGYYRNDLVQFESGSDIAFIFPTDGSFSNLYSFDEDVLLTSGASIPTAADFTASFQTSAVPEPSTFMALAGLGICGFLLRRSRKATARA